MKILLDAFPPLLFFLCYQHYDVYVACAVLMGASVVTLGISRWRQHKIAIHQVISVGLVLLFGSLTLFGRNPAFIQWKVTLIYGLFALALLISLWFGPPLLTRMLGQHITLTPVKWLQLNVALAIFCLACALLNFYIAFYWPPALWVKFKVFGLPLLTLLFTVCSAACLWRDLSNQPPKA